MVNQSDIKKLLDEGLVKIKENGEFEVTEKGLKQGEELLKKDWNARQYMKQVLKYHKENLSGKTSASFEEISRDIDFIDSTDLDIYERYDINKNDDLKNYQLFCKFVEENPKVNSDTIFNLMKEAKYFEIPDKMNLLLQNTSNEVRKIRMPHYFLFMDFSIVIYDAIFHSALVTDLIQIREKLNREDIPEKIDVMSFFSSDKGIGWAKFNLLDKQKDKYLRKLQEYIFNFVDFVNNEEIKFMFKEKTKNNEQRRINRGKLPLPSFHKIYVIGYLKKYLDQLESSELKTRFTHRFWVRGHFRRFLNKEKYKELYERYKHGKLKNTEGKKYNIEEGFLRVWVYPFIKGEGILINKEYKLK